jgi:hypothetical protein
MTQKYFTVCHELVQLLTCQMFKSHKHNKTVALGVTREK